ncbi:MAG: hypothetical protein LBU51_03685 [Bacteroidales bacterium]|nr:hypothetical protein [Bacteroidales bacterium]
MFLIIIFTVYPILICLLPTQEIKKHIHESTPRLVEQGNYPNAIIPRTKYRMDNFTDALVLMQNYLIDPQKPVSSAMLVPRQLFSENIPESLLHQIEQGDGTELNYPRYWHGNTFLIRPLLVFMDYSRIRWTLYAISTLLLIMLSCLIYKKCGLLKTLLVAFGLTCVNFFVTQFSIQFFPVWAIAFITSMLMCIHYKSGTQTLTLILFITGCITSFFDLLTTPLITLGIPLVILFMLWEKEEYIDSFIQGLKYIAILTAMWFLGFAAAWSSKWLIGTLLTDVNVFEDAFGSVLYRINNIDFSRMDAIAINTNFLFLPIIFSVLSVLLLLSLLFFRKDGIRYAAFYLIIALYPYCWFFVVSNHSFMHFWFTYRTQIITILSVLMACSSLISFEKIKKKIGHLQSE